MYHSLSLSLSLFTRFIALSTTSSAAPHAPLNIHRFAWLPILFECLLHHFYSFQPSASAIVVKKRKRHGTEHLEQAVSRPTAALSWQNEFSLSLLFNSHFQVGSIAASHSFLLSFVVISIKVNRLQLLFPSLFLPENRHVLSSGKCNQIKWSSFNQLSILAAISVFELIGFVIAPHRHTCSHSAQRL